LDGKRKRVLMKSSNDFGLAFAAPLLILLAVLGFFQRNGNEKVQVLPALVIGMGLMCTDLLKRSQTRKKILLEISRNINNKS